MADSVPKNGTAARQLWVSIAAIALSAFGAIVVSVIWFGSLSSDVRTNHEAIASMQSRLDASESLQHETEIQLATLRANMTEVETQFHAADQLSDVRIAEDLRWRCQFFEKLYQQSCPSIAYFPQIARPNPTSQ